MYEASFIKSYIQRLDYKQLLTLDEHKLKVLNYFIRRSIYKRERIYRQWPYLNKHKRSYSFLYWPGPSRLKIFKIKKLKNKKLFLPYYSKKLFLPYYFRLTKDKINKIKFFIKLNLFKGKNYPSQKNLVKDEKQLQSDLVKLFLNKDFLLITNTTRFTSVLNIR